MDDDELIIVAAVAAGLYLLHRRQVAAAAASAAPVGTPPGVPPLGAAPDPADTVGTAACIVGTTVEGAPILAAGCAPVVKLADGTLRQIPTYAYAAAPALLLVNPVIGYDKAKDAAKWVGDKLNPTHWF